MLVILSSAFVWKNSSHDIFYYPIWGFKRCGIISWKVRIFFPFCKAEIPRIIFVAFGGLQAKNRHIKLLFGVYIHALALFVWCISIIKYCIKRSCHIIASLVPAKTQLFQNNSLGDIKALVLFVKQQKGSQQQSVAQSIATSGWIWDFWHPTKFMNMSYCQIYLPTQGYYCEHEFIITT